MFSTAEISRMKPDYLFRRNQAVHNPSIIMANFVQKKAFVEVGNSAIHSGGHPEVFRTIEECLVATHGNLSSSSVDRKLKKRVSPKDYFVGRSSNFVYLPLLVRCSKRPKLDETSGNRPFSKHESGQCEKREYSDNKQFTCEVCRKCLIHEQRSSRDKIPPLCKDCCDKKTQEAKDCAAAYACDQSPRLSERRCKLTSHLKPRNSAKKKRAVLSRKKSYKNNNVCNYCNVDYQTKFDLLRHILKMHRRSSPAQSVVGKPIAVLPPFSVRRSDGQPTRFTACGLSVLRTQGMISSSMVEIIRTKSIPSPSTEANGRISSVEKLKVDKCLKEHAGSNHMSKDLYSTQNAPIISRQKSSFLMDSLDPERHKNADNSLGGRRQNVFASKGDNNLLDNSNVIVVWESRIVQKADVNHGDISEQRCLNIQSSNLEILPRCILAHGSSAVTQPGNSVLYVNSSKSMNNETAPTAGDYRVSDVSSALASGSRGECEANGKEITDLTVSISVGGKQTITRNVCLPALSGSEKLKDSESEHKPDIECQMESMSGLSWESDYLASPTFSEKLDYGETSFTFEPNASATDSIQEFASIYTFDENSWRKFLIDVRNGFKNDAIEAVRKVEPSSGSEVLTKDIQTIVGSRNASLSRSF